MLEFALTDHLEGPSNQASSQIYQQVLSYTKQADRLGFEYAFFTEHHCHAHQGHAPDPLLFALHAAAHTQRISLGTAIICLNLHHPQHVAERVAMADTLMNGRLAPGFGSGSTPEEFAMFGMDVTDDDARHRRFSDALQTILQSWQANSSGHEGEFFRLPARQTLPTAPPDLHARSWLAVNSVTSALIAGRLGFNMLFSHLRTPSEYQTYRDEYLRAGGTGKIAANRPVYVGRDDQTAFKEAELALRILWRRFQKEGKIAATIKEPADIGGLCAHPINFIVGGPESVARQIEQLRNAVPFDVLNLEHNWAGLSAEKIADSLNMLAEQVRPVIVL